MIKQSKLKDDLRKQHKQSKEIFSLLLSSKLVPIIRFNDQISVRLIIDFFTES